jgi:hypothetical protein
MSTTYEIHPAAGLFPPLADDALHALAEDIRANGLVHPIILHDNRVLDGRNRLKACEMAGVEPRFTVWQENGSPTAWVLSVNLHRRHLDESQRAMIAARAKEQFEAEAREAQRSLAGTRKDLGANLRQGRAPKSAERAARLVSVSGRSVELASKVIRNGDPELVDAVDRGDVAVSAAATVAGLPKEQQKKAVREKTVREAAKRMRAQKPLPLVAINPRGIAALRSGKRTRAKEIEVLKCVLGVVRSGASSWSSLVTDWNDEHREDMQFALDEADVIKGLFRDLLKRIEQLVKIGETEAGSKLPTVRPKHAEGEDHAS